jgi:hypothetical protein
MRHAQSRYDRTQAVGVVRSRSPRKDIASDQRREPGEYGSTGRWQLRAWQSCWSAAASSDAISNAVKAEKDRPGIAETKAIAEEGFIYGLPIVMNYAVMYEYSVGRDSGQFKAPFNQINNEARVFTYKDTAVITPNSDTPYSLLWLDLQRSPSCSPFQRWKRSALLGNALRRQHIQLRLHRESRDGQ